MTAFSSEQLNFFKFSTVVFEEFPIALRQVFAHLWDTLVAPLPGFKKWDDSPLVRNLFLNKEGGKTKNITTSNSYHYWDCTALFEATLFSQTFSVPDGKGGVTSLAKKYVIPRGVPDGVFHPSVLSPSGSKAETYALALDQLRRLRNTLCHQNSTREIVKADFDSYIHLAKDAFHALGLKSTKIDDVGKLGEKDFPTARLQQLEEELRAERFRPIEDMLDQMRRDGTEVKKDVIHVKTKVEDVETEVKTAVTVLKEAVTVTQEKMEDVRTDLNSAVTDVQTKIDVGTDLKTAVTDVQTKIEDVGTDLKRVVTDVQTKVEDVGTDLKTAVTDVQTRMEDVGTDLKTVVTDVQNKVEDVGSDLKTAVTDVQTKVEDVGTDLKMVVTDVQTRIEDVGTDLKTVVTDVQTKVEDVGSDLKLAVTDVQTKLEDVGSDVKAAVTDVQTRMEDVGSDVKAAVTDVQTKLEDVGSDVKAAVRDVGLNVDFIRQAMQDKVSKGEFVPQSCVPDKIPNFVGRQDQCKEIQSHLTDENTRIVNVWGPPGFGKTSVAISVAHQLREKNIPVYFAPLRGMVSKEELVSKLLSIFAVDMRMPHVSSSHWLIHCLQQVQDRFVVILDNADDLLESEHAKQKQQVLRLIDEILTQCGHIKLLLTTRASLDFLRHSLPINLVKTNALDDVSSTNLIRSLLPDVSDSECICIMKECGKVPLSMRLMCSIIREENISVEELTDELRNSTIVEVLDSESLPDDRRLKMLINKSFQRLPVREKKAFVSLAVFPGWFNAKEATAVLGVKSDVTTKKIIRTLERNSLIDSGESFTRFTIHSLFRSFVEEQRNKEEMVKVTFCSAQHDYHDYYISCFRNANETFLTGLSYEALLTVGEHRESIFSSLNNGLRDDDLYPIVVEVLSMAELFLCALLPDEEELFEQLYNTAVKEARKRKNLFDERNLLTAKSFRHWGWLSSDRQTWDYSLNSENMTEADTPAKLVCYYGVYQLLSGNHDEGISTILSAARRLSYRSDENVLKAILCEVLQDLLQEDEKMTSDFKMLHDQCKDWWKAKFPSLASATYVEGTLESLLNEGLIFTSLCFKLLLVNEESVDQEQYFVNMFDKFIQAVCKGQADNSSIPLCIYTLNVLLQEPLESHMLHSPVIAHIPLGFLSCCIDQVRPSYLNFKKFTDHVLKSGVCSVQSYNSLKQLMKSLAQLVKRFSVFKPMIMTCLQLDEADPFQRDSRAFYSPIGDTFERTLNWASKTCFGTDLVDLAKTYDNLAKVKCYLDHRSEAIVSHLQAIGIREEHLGNHIDTVTSLIDIGSIYFEMSNAVEADRAFQRALDLKKKLDIYDNEDTSSIYVLLAENHYSLGNHEDALNSHLKALEIRKKHLGEHRLTATSSNEAGRLCFELQRYPEALQFCEQALNFRIDLLGEDVDTAESFFLLGCIHFKMSENESAVLNFQEAAEMQSNLLGDHKDTASSYHNLALAQYDMGELHGALDSLQKATDMRSQTLGYHKDTASSYHHLGVVQHSMGDLAGALESLKKAAKIRSKELGDHENTASSYHWLGVVQRDIGEDIPGALETLEKAAIMRSILLGDHEDTANSYHDLGSVHYLIGDLNKASDFLQKAVDMRSCSPGDHQNTATSYHLLGSVQFDMKDYDRALESLQRAWQLRNERLGEDHPDTASTLYLLSLAYEASLLKS